MDAALNGAASFFVSCFLVRCRGDVPKPPEESSIITATSSGHLREGEAGKVSVTSNIKLAKFDIWNNFCIRK